ncbi:MAG TPA: S49 family peptidase, partial [Abditibacteriaceae bacterium]
SIGVISQFMNYKDLFKKVGLDTATIKSGKFKDAGNPARDLTPEERQLFQQMINDVYQQFIDDVAAGRKGKLTRAQLLKLADGRVYTGRQAKNNKLIDHLGGLQDAIAAAAKRGGISGEPKVKEFGSGGLFGSMFGAEAESAVAQSVASAGAAAGDAAGKALVQSLQNSTESSAVRSAPQMR